MVRSSTLLQGYRAQSRTATLKTLCFLFYFVVFLECNRAAQPVQSSTLLDSSYVPALWAVCEFSLLFYCYFSFYYLIFFLFLFSCRETFQRPMSHLHIAMTQRPMNTSFSRSGDDGYFDSYNPTWSQQSNFSWQGQVLGNPTPQFHEPHQQSSPPFYGQSYSFLVHNEANIQLLEYIAKLESYQEELSPNYWPPQYQEEEPSPQFYGQSYSCLSPSLRQSTSHI